ncbi:hypothetical protein IMSAGC006_02053 [Muribaculaceae bacterium]|nr:hypothetical protein IMSAGC006_02053 [Muribaculaceae bacterium]
MASIPLPLLIATLVRRLHCWKAPLPMLFTLPGIVTSVRLVHSANAYAPMSDNDSGRFSRDSFPQPSNAYDGIDVTLLPNATSDSSVCPANGDSAMSRPMYTSRISEEKAVSCIEMGPSPFSTVTLAIPSHRSNARAPIEVTDPGRVTSVSDEQPRNAFRPIDMRVLGRLTVLRLAHPLKAPSRISDTGAPTVSVFR